MTDFNVGFEDIIQKFIAWAEDEPRLRGAVIIGSRARQNLPADEWSDLDIILFDEDIERFIRSAGWLDRFGEVLLTFLEQTPSGGWERRALFANGCDVDFALVPAGMLPQMAQGPLDAELADLIGRGTRILVDKDGLLAQIQRLPVPEQALYQQPEEAEFLNLVHDFWYHSVWTMKHLRRGELWWAKGGSDSYMKALLLRMLEWHARATRGPQWDTWMRGRFLEQWADPRAVAALPNAFAHYQSQDIARALLSTMEIFSWLSTETAQAWGYSYPYQGAQAAAALVERLIAGMCDDEQDLP